MKNVLRKSRISIIGLFLSVFVVATPAQQRADVYRILGISVEGNRTGDPAAIIANTGLKVGDEISIPGEQTRQAIQRLHNLRLFEDVQLLIENRIQDGVYLLIRVRENPRLDRIEIRGNDEMSEDDVLKHLGLLKGQIVTGQDLSSVIRTLKREYDAEGYMNAVVTPRLVSVSDTVNRVALVVEIQEGPQVKVDAIRFHGNSVYDDDDLQGEMVEVLVFEQV
jgi:outer membrane protein insertion porin family